MGRAEVRVAITIWVPKSKPRFHLFAFGKAEVRVALNDRAERYRSCNLVTERAVTERASYSSHISLISQFSTTLFAHLQKNAYLCAFSI